MPRIHRVAQLALVCIVLAGVSVGAYRRLHAPPPGPAFTKVAVTRGDVVESSIATGALAATRSVAIGSQVSGVVKKLHVDYNSLVFKGEVLAEIDPTLSQAALDAAKASLQRVGSDRVSHQATFDSDDLNLKRTKALADQSLATAQDLELAEVQVKSDRAILDEDTRSATIAQTNVDQAQANLDHCTITSPIDGVVIARNVDEGETVTASMTAPTLYTLGSNLTSLLLMGDMDESDMANVRPGQHVRFTVEAYPTTFEGHVVEVRLNPNTSNNVVTYQTVVNVNNPGLLLRPGMTASYRVETSTALSVLRVPSQALRFKPSTNVFTALHEKPPVVPASAKPVVETDPLSHNALPAAGTITIDTRFSPVQHVERPATVWVLENQQLEPVPVLTGISDGAWTEIVSGDVHEGEELVSLVVLPKIK